MAERILIAALFGVAQACVVWGVSTGLHLKHVWPGTIFSFAIGTATTLIFLRAGS